MTTHTPLAPATAAEVHSLLAQFLYRRTQDFQTTPQTWHAADPLTQALHSTQASDLLSALTTVRRMANILIHDHAIPEDDAWCWAWGNHLRVDAILNARITDGRETEDGA